MQFNTLNILKSQIPDTFGYFQNLPDYHQVIANSGMVVRIGDGIVRVYGLTGVKAGEMIFIGLKNIRGMVINLEHSSVGAVVFGNDRLVVQGDIARRSYEIMNRTVTYARYSRVISSPFSAMQKRAYSILSKRILAGSPSVKLWFDSVTSDYELNFRRFSPKWLVQYYTEIAPRLAILILLGYLLTKVGIDLFWHDWLYCIVYANIVITFWGGCFRVWSNWDVSLGDAKLLSSLLTDYRSNTIWNNFILFSAKLLPGATKAKGAVAPFLQGVAATGTSIAAIDRGLGHLAGGASFLDNTLWEAANRVDHEEYVHNKEAFSNNLTRLAELKICKKLNPNYPVRQFIDPIIPKKK